MWLGVLAVCGLENVDIAKNGKEEGGGEEGMSEKLYWKLASQTWRREGNESVLRALCH